MGEGVLCPPSHMNYSLLDSVIYVRWVNFSISVTSINEVLWLPNPLERKLRARDVDDNRQWLVNTLVTENKMTLTTWGITHTSIKGTHFIVRLGDAGHSGVSDHGEWSYFVAKSGASLPFSSFIIMLCERAGVPKEKRDDMISYNVTFDLLSMKGVPRSGRKKRKAETDDEHSEGQGCSGSGPSRPTGPFK
ncbi:hypothetical protein HAX54_037999 [Datura stramonium]|uniref:Uncharacterized protein n=1 Tax=Datura stramonium TaxID=4076 RepID=A0ABS8VN55_DATST|nr:hypothetical protein [Datura stramonium]